MSLTTVSGNSNLCMSCHNTEGLAWPVPFVDTDRANPYGATDDRTDFQGTSHAWGVDATSDAAGAVSPSDPEIASRLDNGKIVCSTCHDQHNHNAGTPFLRIDNTGNAMCKDCHAARDVTSSADGSHPVGVPIPLSDFYESPTTLQLDSGNVECTTCHSLHYADSGGANSGAGDGYILNMSLETICYDCHTYSSTSPHMKSDTGALWPGAQYGTDYARVSGSDVVPRGSTGGTPSSAMPSGKRGWCINCHWPHGWTDDNPAGQNYPYLNIEQSPTDADTLTATPDPGDGNDLCMTCHDTAQGIVQAIDWSSSGDQHGGNGAGGTSKGDLKEPFLTWSNNYSNNLIGACTDCHNPHDNTNEYLIKTMVNGQSVSVPSIGGSQDLYSLCTSCHTVVSHGMGGMGGGWGSCSACHYHGATGGMSSRTF